MIEAKLCNIEPGWADVYTDEDAYIGHVSQTTTGRWEAWSLYLGATSDPKPTRTAAAAWLVQFGSRAAFLGAPDATLR